MPIIAGVLLTAGLIALVFPKLSQWSYEKGAEKVKEDFLTNNAAADNSAFEALYALLQVENKELFETGQSGLSDAFSYEQPAVDLSEYGIKDNCIGFISIPTAQIDLPIYLGANHANMRKGAVHLTETSYPVGGINTNTVIAAHRGRIVEMFRRIHLIEIGDELTIQNFRETLTYRAKEKKIIWPNEIEEILIQPDSDILTLISCHPLGGEAQRYVVYCERVVTEGN